ncbi:hypothetical protein FZEAL_1421 [Fusarium zealandicum]|uniref:Uncharacterized protein n=1 Tax=Fusarium zealandicum TaxID=1053134 RepID=A0A8H4XNU2_9HYPO|nr:hypothetical protein FZEAL_1421 [Fusarium zealandicum]
MPRYRAPSRITRRARMGQVRMRQARIQPWLPRLEEILWQFGTSWQQYYDFMATPDIQVAQAELWDDWYVKQPSTYRFEPCLRHVERVLLLTEIEPERMAYCQPNPNKETWSEVGHVVRYVIRWWTAFTRSVSYQRQVITQDERMSLVSQVVNHAQLYLKSRRDNSYLLPHITGVSAPDESG